MTRYLDEARNAGGFKDRLNLVLLKYKESKSFMDGAKLKKLERLYPDNTIYEVGVIEELRNRKFIFRVNAEGGIDENGNAYKIENGLPEYWQTTFNGEKALNSKLFPSESAKETFDLRFRLFQVVGICIAAFGGLITLVTFFYKVLKGFFDQ